MLSDGEINAITGDAPVLKYFAHTNPNRPLTVVGAIFEPDEYGFAMPQDSSLTAATDSREIIGAQESGELEELRARYFGSQQ